MHLLFDFFLAMRLPFKRNNNNNNNINIASWMYLLIATINAKLHPSSLMFTCTQVSMVIILIDSLLTCLVVLFQRQQIASLLFNFLGTWEKNSTHIAIHDVHRKRASDITGNKSENRLC